MTLLTAVMAVLLTALPARAQIGDPANADTHWDARLTSVKGEVVVHPADGGEEAAGEEGMPLDAGDRVTVGTGGEAEVALDDGSLIVVRENSDFTLEKTERAESVFSLALGSILAKIQHLGDQRLQVRTPSAVAAVRGTEFGVEVEGDQQSHVGVFDEGRVEVEGSGGKEVLTPNQETSVAHGQAPLKARALQRFLVHRARMRAQVRRLRVIRRNWKKMPPSQRRAMRQKALTRLRALRRQNREQRERLRQQRRGEPSDRERERRRFPRRNPRRKTAPKKDLRRKPLRKPGAKP